MTAKPSTHPTPRRTAIAAAIVCVFALVSTPAVHAQPVSNSTLYYRMGGGTPGGGANNRGQTSQALGLQANLRLNYSCGKFDVGMSWGNIMNNISRLGQQVTNAVQAGIASLPLYVLQRAQPGLYQLFQNYSQKADLLVASSLKTCEETEAMIRAGQNPYEDWIKMAKGDAWKVKANTSGDIVQAKIDINKNEEAQRTGVNWVFGQKAGGINSLPLRPIRDLSVAGYNATLNKSVTASSSTSYAGSTDKSTRLVQAFASPDDLAKFTTEVLGDKRVYTCSQSADCPTATAVTTASGLGPKYEAEVDQVLPKLQAMAGAPSGSPYADLNTIAAPGMAISPQLLDALRKLPPDTRGIAVTRLGQELAMHRVIDKALVARAVLLTGLSLPEVTAAGDAMRDTQSQIDRLTQFINDLMFEARIRKELTSDTALAIMGSQFQADSRSMRVPDGRAADPQPMENGRVKVTP
ncbi:integrating conjugative element protein [Acidovorax sp. SUPP2539]|uniref:integrating conjugative element protein n=1 Tax=Acidovorax sp. SUPP2539 TaxID=2920878 RepID=UPI0023DE4288|nr:integrating conjugative element protein [Acidovorax sp. SUPP2539]GKS92635.1 integrating conjugative element protein [Acidovorax sp. SUPP2539]